MPHSNDYGYAEFFKRTPSWTTESDIVIDIMDVVPRWLLRKVKVVSNTADHCVCLEVPIKPWTKETSLITDLARQASKWIFRDEQAIAPEVARFCFKVDVHLWPWAYFWLGRKHRYLQDILQQRCDRLSPAGLVGLVYVR